MATDDAKAAASKLRFPEFRGADPWRRTRLGDAGTFIRGLTYGAGDVQPEGLLVIRSTNIQSDELVLDRDTVFVGKDCLPEQHLKVGDIAICMSNGSKALVGKSAEFTGAFTGQITVGAFCAIFRPFVTFAKLAFRSDSYADFVASAIGGGNINNLKISNLESFEFAVPSSQDEQQKVAACLTSLDEVIAAQGHKVEALKAHKRGLMQELFPREGETRPRLRFPEFRNAPDWARGKAADIVDVLQGYGFPERLQGSRDGEFPFYKVSDISACVGAGGILLDEANNHIDADVLEELRAKLMPVGSTVFAKIGEAIRSNKRAITSRPCLVDNNAAGVKAIAGLAHDRFVYYLWCQIPLIEYAGGVVPAVNKSAIEQIPICYPESDEQQRIADCLSSIDTQITAETNQLGALKIHKQGLMQQLFPAREARGA